MDSKNKRSVTINRKIRNQIIALGLFTFMFTLIIYFFLFVIFPGRETLMQSSRELTAIKYMIVILVLFFGMICFALGFLYSQEMFQGLFKRIDAICLAVSKGEKAQKLSFRKKDRIHFFADTFNAMLETVQKEKPSEEKK